MQLKPLIRNNFYNTGIEVQKNNLGVINIQGMVITTNNGTTGISCRDITNSDIDIRSNSINLFGNQANANVFAGISIDNALLGGFGGLFQTIAIENNVIRQARRGIFVRTIRGAAIRNNQIYINKNPFNLFFNGFQYVGISVQNSIFTEISGNLVQRGFGNTSALDEQFLTGIFVANSPISPTNENRLNRMGKGIVFSGNCTNSFISCNRMTRNYTGMLFTNAVIGDQGFAPGANPNFANGLTWDNRWFNTVGPNGSDGNMATFTNVYSRTSGNYDPDESVNLLNTGFSLIGLASNSASPCSQGGGQIGGGFPGGRSILLGPSVYGTNNYSILAQELDVYDQYMAYGIMLDDSSWIYQGTPDDADYLAYFQNVGNTGHGKACEAHRDLVEKDTSMAAHKKDQMALTCAQESLMNEVLGIYLASYSDTAYLLNQQQIADLEYIACLDATENGPAVYSARALLGKRDICINSNHLRMEINEEEDIAEQVAFARIYPNPSIGSFKLEYKLEQSGELAVYDINGKLLHNKALPSGHNVMDVELDELSSGVYIYKIISGGELAKQGRLVITP